MVGGIESERSRGKSGNSDVVLLFLCMWGFWVG
jgi:hypothetical protein